jgi:hypothetical protein
MLFYHTQHVINKQMKTNEGDEEDVESDDEILCTRVVFAFSKRIISCMHHFHCSSYTMLLLCD